jgi:L-fucose isomerase-like protein
MKYQSKRPTKPRVALVTLSDHAFIPSFAPYNEGARATRDEYITQVRRDSAEFFSACETEVVLNEWVNSVESARTTGARLRQDAMDVLAITVPIWPGGDLVLELAKAITGLPTIIWTPISGKTNTLCGFYETTSDLKSVGVTFEPVLGRTAEAKAQIRSFAKAAMAVRKLRTSRVAQIGYTPQAFVDVTGSELDLRSRLGLEVAHLDISEIYSKVNKVTPEEAQQVTTEFKQKAGKLNVDEKEMMVPAKICVAVDKIVEKYKLDGYALSCTSMSYELAHPCFALSRSTERGVVGSCEGDLPSAIMLLIMREITGNPPAVFDIDSGDPDRNVLNLWHCGHLATSLAESTSNITVTPPLFGKDVMGPGAVLFFPMKPGKVTLASLSGKADRIFFTSGEALKLEGEKGFGAYSEIKLDCGLIDVLQTLAKSGFGHHLCVVHDDIRDALGGFCRILGISPISPVTGS